MIRCFSLAAALCAIIIPAPPAHAVSPAGAVDGPASLAMWTTMPVLDHTLYATSAVTNTTQMTGTVRIATLVADYFEQKVQDILALRAQDIGFGNLVKAFFLVMEADVTLEQILEMRRQDIGWGEIRKDLGLHPGMPHASLGQIVSQGRAKKGLDWIPLGWQKKAEGWAPPGQVNKEGEGSDRAPPGQSQKLKEWTPPGKTGKGKD
jgi:hypothetical protein